MENLADTASRLARVRPENPLDALLALFDEVQGLHRMIKKVVSASRYNRGGYDGPFASAKYFDVPTTGPIRIYAGAEEPTGLMFTWSGGGNAGDIVYISGDRQQMFGGFPLDVAAVGTFRLMAAEDESLYAITFRAGGGAVEQRIVMRECLT